MKTKTFQFLLSLTMAISTLWLIACNNDNENLLVTNEDIPSTGIPQSIVSAFTARYPSVDGVAWESGSDYYKAGFSDSTSGTNVWFNTNGHWQRTETDLRPDQLPQAVLYYIKNNYPDYHIDDCELIETPTMSYYEIELDKAGVPDVHLALNAAGEIISGEQNHPNQIPQAVLAAFDAKYPSALHVEWEKGISYYKAEFIFNGNEVDALFALDGTWQRSETELTANQLPQTIKNYIATNYPTNRVDDCDLIETTETKYYVVELDGANDADIYLKFNADGQIEQAQGQGGNQNQGGGQSQGGAQNSKNQIPDAVRTAFTAQYPTAIEVEWEIKGGKYNVEFRLGANEVEAWYNTDGGWIRSETELYASQLPQAVSAYVVSNYPSFQIDDCSFVEMPSGSFYLIELEKKGSPDVYLKLSANGEVMP